MPMEKMSAKSVMRLSVKRAGRKREREFERGRMAIATMPASRQPSVNQMRRDTPITAMPA